MDENQLFLISHSRLRPRLDLLSRLAIIPQHMDRAKLISFFLLRPHIRSNAFHGIASQTRVAEKKRFLFLHHRTRMKKIIKNAIKCKVIERAAREASTDTKNIYNFRVSCFRGRFGAEANRIGFGGALACQNLLFHVSIVEHHLEAPMMRRHIFHSIQKHVKNLFHQNKTECDADYSDDERNL